MFFFNLIFFSSRISKPGINLGNRVSIGEARVLTGYGPPGYHQPESGYGEYLALGRTMAEGFF
jgi:hypothetical protein